MSMAYAVKHYNMYKVYDTKKLLDGILEKLPYGPATPCDLFIALTSTLTLTLTKCILLTGVRVP